MGRKFGSMSHNRHAMMRERLLYIGGGALTFALAAIVALIIYSYNEADAHQAVSAPEQPMEVAAFGTVVLVAPKVAVPHGTKLSTVSFREIHWPRNEVPEGSIREVSEISDMYAKVDLPANQPILRANVSPTPPLGGVADLIPPGHRATTIEVDATSGVEGWASPGARVDILVTYSDPDTNIKKTQIAVEDAVVVSFNGQTRGSATGRMDSPGNRFATTATATLAVPTKDALRIHTARAMGKISLILRNTADTTTSGTQEVNEMDFNRAKKQEQETADTIGYVRYEAHDGSTRQLEFRNDKRWHVVDGDM